MNFKIISFSAAALIAVVSGQPELPECTIGVDTEACTTAFGHDGYFIHMVMDESFTPPSGGAAGGSPRGGGFRGGRGGAGGRGFGGPGGMLTRSKCVPIDFPEPDEDAPGRGVGGGVDRPIPQINCGCEGGVCPTQISCDCSCEITLRFGTTMAGSKATITKPDGSTMTKCVPPVYADVDSYNCITDCSIEVDTPFL